MSFSLNFCSFEDVGEAVDSDIYKLSDKVFASCKLYLDGARCLSAEHPLSRDLFAENPVDRSNIVCVVLL